MTDNMITPTTPMKSSPLEGGVRRDRFLLIVSDWREQLQPGGVQSYLFSLAQGFENLGETVKVLAVVQPDESVHLGLLEKFAPWAIPFHMVDDDKPTNWLGRKSVSFLEILRCVSRKCRQVLDKSSIFGHSTEAMANFERVLSEVNPTAVGFGNFNGRLYPLALALLDRQIPYGIIAHGWDIRRVVLSNDFIKRKTMLKGASWIAANSRFTKSLLEKWNIPTDPIRIIHPPISEEAIRESSSFEPVPRQVDELVLVTVCRLVKDKGIELVLRALKILEARGIPFRYLVGGDGSDRKLFEGLANELGLRDKVHFKGYVEGREKWDLFGSGDIFVMPSLAVTEAQQEGFGIAYIEAAAFGVPSVGSRTGGIPDAVVDGETGILVPDETPLSLADALTFLYRNPEKRRQMGRAARERARRQFSPEAIATRFKEEATKSDGLVRRHIALPGMVSSSTS